MSRVSLNPDSRGLSYIDLSKLHISIRYIVLNE